MIRASDLIRAVFAPLTEIAILFPLLMFWGLVAAGAYRPPFGIAIVVLSLPPLFRYQSFIAEACANGRVPGAFDAEFFSWIGTGWTMFPLWLAILLGYVGVRAAAAWGSAGAWLTLVLAAGVVPASLAVLAITHSAWQAMNPLALFRIYQRGGPIFIIAPAYVLLLAGLTLAVGSLPLWALIGIGIFGLFSLAALTGTLIAPVRLVEDVYIPDPLEPDERESAEDLKKQREAALAHAYAFVSRDNRDGGFRHLFGEIEKDPDTVAAWDWYLNRMFGWEDQVHALFFARDYVRDALAHGEDVRALKAVMRCRLVDEQFRPRREDVPALIEAAERTGNAELAEVLRRG